MRICVIDDLVSVNLVESMLNCNLANSIYACICSSECLTCGRCNAQYALLVQLRDNAVSETINNPIVDLQLLLKP